VFFCNICGKILKFKLLPSRIVVEAGDNCCALFFSGEIILTRSGIMAKRSGLLEQESAAFAEEKSRERPSRSNLSHTAATSTKRPKIDELLENTLFNIKPNESLTKREGEILRLIVAGNTNKKIAQIICLNERTIEYHRHRLMRKLGTKTAADLVKRAITMGIA